MTKSEKNAYQILKNEGYLVERPVRTRWHRIDFFNLFDFIAVKEDKIRFIQVGVKYLSERPKEWQERFKNFPLPPNSTKEYWRWDRKKKVFIKENFN